MADENNNVPNVIPIDEKLIASATKIQAVQRGRKSRVEVQEMKEHIKKCLVFVENMARMMVLLASLKFGIGVKDRRILESYLCPNIVEGIEQGWEETVDSAVSYLLKSSLSTSGKDAVVLPATFESEIDFEGFKKKLTTVFDRLHKGINLTSSIAKDAEGQERK